LRESQVAEAVKSVPQNLVPKGRKKKKENKIDKLDVKIDDICQSVFVCSNQ
jgi:phosphate transport system protein